MGNHTSKERKKNVQRRYSCPPPEVANKADSEKSSNESLQHSRSCSELGNSSSSLNKKKDGSLDSVNTTEANKNIDYSSILASNPSSLAALAKERSSSQRSVHNSSSSVNDKYNIDDILQKIFDMRKNIKHGKSNSRSIGLKNGEIIKLCVYAREIFLSQPVLIEVNPKPSLVIAGDVHGQYTDLLRIFDRMGHPPQTNYLFMGDYVDRGKKSLETILLLLAYKVKYPENFFLLRGNHECASINRVYGFYDECKRRANLKVWKSFTDLFNCLPVAAVVAGKIFCVHGGLSPSLHTMDDILKIKRPTDVPEFDLLNDLLWSDPSETAQDWEDNERGVSYCFGKSVVQEFLTRNDFDLVCRAHMVVEDGYEFFGNRILVTVFSAPNYCGEFDNNGAVMLVNEDLLCSFEIIQALDANGEPINTMSYSNDYIKETCPSADEIPPVDENPSTITDDTNGSNELLKEDVIEEENNKLAKETEIINIDNNSGKDEIKNEGEKVEEEKTEESTKEGESIAEGLKSVVEDVKEEIKEIVGEVSGKIMEVKDIITEKITGDGNDEVKEENKEEVQEETKTDVKEEVKEEIKTDVKEEVKEETKTDVKEEVKEELKEEIKEVKEEVTKEVKEEVSKEVKEETTDPPAN